MLSLIVVCGLIILSACDTNMTPEARLAKLRKLVDEEKYDDALKEIPLLRTTIPNDSAFLMLAGKTYVALKIVDSAHACAKQYTALYPTRLEGYRFLYGTGEILEDYDAQIWAVSQLGYLEDNRRKYHTEIARLNYMRGEYGQALRTCDMILEYDPENPNALFIMSNSLAAIGKIDSAITIMEALDRRTPDKIEVMSNLASFLVEKRNYDQAAVHFKRMTTIFPDYIPAWYGLGNVLLSKGDSTGAIEAYRQVYSRDSTFLGIDSIMNKLVPFLIR